MKDAHQRLIGKYPRYDTWHQHPRHELFHWLLFISASALTFVLILSNAGVGLGKGGNLPRGSVPAFAGRITGNTPTHVLVSFTEGTSRSKKQDILVRHHLTESSEIPEIGVEILSLGKNITPANAAAALMSEGIGIDFAEPDAVLEPSFLPNDPAYSSEWQHPLMHAPAAWDTANGSGVTIAIIDTGVDGTHPDLLPHMIAGWNFYNGNNDTEDVFGHGTQVAGAAAGVGNNGIAIVGTAYTATIMPLRVSDANGNATYSAIANALVYAADHGAKIANISYQVGGSRTIERAAQYLKDHGGITVVAEGNGGADTRNRNSGDLISVSATDRFDMVTSWSNYGKDVDVSAPGQAILTTTIGGGTDYYSGTSFSAPITAGVLALIWETNPELSPDDAAQILFDSAADLGKAGWDASYGWGRVDAKNAVLMAENYTPVATTDKGNGKGRNK